MLVQIDHFQEVLLGLALALLDVHQQQGQQEGNPRGDEDRHEVDHAGAPGAGRYAMGICRAKALIPILLPQAWEFVIDPRNMPLWVPYIESVAGIDRPMQTGELGC